MMTLYESQHSNREGKTLSDYTPKKKIVSLYSMPGKAHGQRSLVGYSTWGRKESDTTERLHSQACGSIFDLLCWKGVLQYQKLPT